MTASLMTQARRTRRDLKAQTTRQHPLKGWRLRQRGADGKPLTLWGAARMVNSTAADWQAWEEGAKLPRAEKLVALCEVTGLMPNDFYFKNGMPYRLWRNHRQALEQAIKG